jgi:predicted RNA-binding Zn-ribbon protein involved in translation (DUF1610 family)
MYPIRSSIPTLSASKIHKVSAIIDSGKTRKGAKVQEIVTWDEMVEALSAFGYSMTFSTSSKQACIELHVPGTLNGVRVFTGFDHDHLITRWNDVSVSTFAKGVKDTYTLVRDYSCLTRASNSQMSASDRKTAFLSELVSSVRASIAYAEKAKTVLCPMCLSVMITRTRNRDGSKFFGCTNYPSCRFCLNMEGV